VIVRAWVYEVSADAYARKEVCTERVVRQVAARARVIRPQGCVPDIQRPRQVFLGLHVFTLGGGQCTEIVSVVAMARAFWSGDFSQIDRARL